MKRFKDLQVGDKVYSLSFDWVGFNVGGNIKESQVKKNEAGELYLCHMNGDEEAVDYLFNCKELPDTTVIPCYSNDYYDVVYASDVRSIYGYIENFMKNEIKKSQERLDNLNEKIKIVSDKLNELK